jgi:hypothetical protein
MNAGAITGQGNWVYIIGNEIFGIEGTIDLQNHGIYAGTSAYGWNILFNWFHDLTGGSGIQCNDSDGGSGVLSTPEGIWTGFTNMKIGYNWIENTAKYGLIFADVGSNVGTLDFIAWNNIFINTGLPAFRTNTNTATSNGLFVFNTCYNCMTTLSGTGNGYIRNEGIQNSPNHSIKIYNNIFAFGPNTYTGTQWFVDASGSSTGFDFKRNLYWSNGVNPAPNSPSTIGDNVAVIGDPLFTNVASSDFTLQATSPALNAGTYALPSGTYVLDDYTAQNNRSYGGAPDIGAYERQDSRPFILTNPVVSGTNQATQTVTTTNGSWGNAPTSYSYQWTEDNSVVGTAASYNLVGADAGKSLAVIVTATNASGSSSVTVNVGTTAVGPSAPVNTVAPVVSGTTQQGNVLSTTNGTWVNTVDGYSYVWQRSASNTGPWTNIGGATASTYTLGAGDVNNYVRCEVIAINTTQGNGLAYSNAVGQISAVTADPIIRVVSATPNVGTGLITTGNVAINVSTPNDVQAGNWIMIAVTSWNQSPAGATFSDSQGHVNANFSTSVGVEYIDPFGTCYAYIKSTIDGPYTATINLNGASYAVGAVFVAEISAGDISTFVDTAPAVGGADAVTSGTITLPTTNYSKDLLVSAIAWQTSGVTLTADPSWTQVGTELDPQTYLGFSLFTRKPGATGTYSYGVSLSSSTKWRGSAISIKGS